MRAMNHSILLVSLLLHSLGLPLALAQDPIQHSPQTAPSLRQQFEEFKATARQTISDFDANSRLNRRIVNQMETLEGAPLVQEDHAKNWGFFKFISPNEVYGSYFEPCLPKQKGAYISVGTFRALNAGSSGKVEPLILFDFDRGTKLFNMVTLQCVAMSQDRYEMMSLLFTGQRQADLIEKARREKMNPHQFIFQLNRLVEPGKIVVRWQALGIQVPKESDWILFRRHIEDQLRTDIPRDLKHFDRAETTEKTFLGNDTRYGNLKKLVLDGQVSMVTGDLSDNNALTHLSKTLREKGIQVSAMDISNANDYFYQDNGHRNFVNNLKSLPFVPGGKLLFTDDAPWGVQPKPHADTWAYYSVPAANIGNMEKDLAEGNYQQVRDHFSVDPAPFNQHGVLYTREEERCSEENAGTENLKQPNLFRLMNPNH